MNRLHVHLEVKDLGRSVGFYSALFGKAPDKREADYAKWMLDDPRANIAISRVGAPGVDHVGLQVDQDSELEALAARLKDAGAPVAEEKAATCCYAKSDKYWTQSPDGAKWELYRTYGDARTCGAAPAKESPGALVKGPCCVA